ncbi:uncharacterized protein LOC134195896 [Corticium candelabrum]|uniref:uncharacterized protein LOC134195896 n=1 Tax=Corticium candelabrum TaxID=121492 RepID=UPI002E275C99|nr:uncharacterized protein LOC134195896 [Corticium candelabrum]
MKFDRHPTELLIVLVVFLRSHAHPNSNNEPVEAPRSPWPRPDAAVMETVQTYISWGSSAGQATPDCKRFLATFGANRSWESPFTSNEFMEYDIEGACNRLAMNLSWRVASLDAGQYLYPLYSQHLGMESYWKVGFVWNAVGGAKNLSHVFNRKEYNFTIITVLWLQVYPNNKSYIFNAVDVFWPDAEATFPTTLTNMVDNYVSFLGGNCKTWAELFWRDVGMVTVSGEDTGYYGPTGLTEYCSKMVYMWSSYVHDVDDMSYSVDIYSSTVEKVAFTWTRTGVYLGRVRTDEILTVFYIRSAPTPKADLKIFIAWDFLQPPMEEASLMT